MFSPVNYFRVVFEKTCCFSKIGVNLLYIFRFTVYFPILYPFIDYCASLTFILTIGELYMVQDQVGMVKV